MKWIECPESESRAFCLLVLAPENGSRVHLDLAQSHWLSGNYQVLQCDTAGCLFKDGGAVSEKAAKKERWSSLISCRNVLVLSVALSPNPEHLIVFAAFWKIIILENLLKWALSSANLKRNSWIQKDWNKGYLITGLVVEDPLNRWLFQNAWVKAGLCQRVKRINITYISFVVLKLFSFQGVVFIICQVFSSDNLGQI